MKTQTFRASFLRSLLSTCGPLLILLEFCLGHAQVVHAAPPLQFTAESYVVGEGDGVAIISVVRFGPTNGIVSANFRTVSGTALAGADYTNTFGIVIVAPGETNKTIAIPIRENDIIEDEETFEVELAIDISMPPQKARVTIVDNDMAPPGGALRFASNSYTVSEASNATVTVIRTHGSLGTATATYTTANGDGALAGLDYVTTSGTLTFANGETNKVITVPIIYDFDPEGSESFFVAITSVTNAGWGSVPSTLVTVRDIDVNAAPCTAEGIAAAILAGGTLKFECAAKIILPHTLPVTRHATLDANGHQVTLSGGGGTRLFDVVSNATLTLIDLNLVDGRATGTNGGSFQTGGMGQGGAICVKDGALIAIDCRFTNNVAGGGAGGPSTDPLFGPPRSGGIGCGGAVALLKGSVSLSNCVLSANRASGGNGGAASGSFAFGGIGGTSRGGAIYVESGQVEMIGTTLVANLSSPGSSGSGTFSGDYPGTTGGALYIDSGSLNSSGCVWRANSADSSGGAIHNRNGAVILTSCKFDGNSVTFDRPSRGGAVFSDSNSVGIVDCLFTNNFAIGAGGSILRSTIRQGGIGLGGAVCILDGIAGITNSAFINNLAAGGNGFISGAPGPALAGNGQGGGLSSQGFTDLLNCTFVGNSAQAGQVVNLYSTGSGGAIASGGGVLSLNYSTIASNSVSDSRTNASVGGGCYQFGGGFNLANSILAGNKANGSLGGNFFGTFTDGGHNLSSDATPTFSTQSSRNNIDPRLNPLADNGGPTPTMSLSLNSPAVDRGNDLNCPATDQRGITRPGLSHCDIGAYELAPTFFQIASITPTNGTAFLISGIGIPYDTFALEGTEDFSNWSNAGTGTVSSNGWFRTETTNGLPFRFYRTKTP